MRKLVARVGLLAAGLLLALALLEGSLWLGHLAFATDTLEVTLGDGDVSVLCLGDSHTFGVYGPVEESYPARLQAFLDASLGVGRAEVVRAALPGLGTATLRRQLPELLARHRPRVVVMLGGLNNRWNHADRDAVDRSPPPWTRLRLWRLAGTWLTQRAAAPGDESAQLEGRRLAAGALLDDAALARTIRDDLTAMVALCRDEQALPLLLTYPAPDPPLRVANEAIRQAAAESGAPLLDLARRFEELLRTVPYEKLLIPGDFHPRPAGHEQVARAVAAWILERWPGAPVLLEAAPAAPAATIRLTADPDRPEVLCVEGPPGRQFRIYLSLSEAPPARLPRVALPLGADELFLQTRERPELAGVLDGQGKARVVLDPARLPSGANAAPLRAVAVLLRPAGPEEARDEFRAERASAPVLLQP